MIVWPSLIVLDMDKVLYLQVHATICIILLEVCTQQLVPYLIWDLAIIELSVKCLCNLQHTIHIGLHHVNYIHKKLAVKLLVPVAPTWLANHTFGTATTSKLVLLLYNNLIKADSTPTRWTINRIFYPLFNICTSACQHAQ